MSKFYCKVCHDAGKPESEFRNHGVRDRNGNITCPTLLNTKCRYCSKLGHTTKYCSELANKNNAVHAKQNKIVPKQPIQKPIQQKQMNHFSVLDNDSDEEQEEADKESEKKLTGWAAIAAKPKEEVVVVNTDMVTLTRSPGKMNKPKVEQVPESNEEVKPLAFTRRWADLSDSEDDDDYYYRSQTSLAKEQIDGYDW